MYKKALLHFKKVDPLLYKYAQLIEIEEREISNDYFFDLCDSIISQQLSVKAGNTILNRFKALFPDEKITPEKVLALSDETIRGVGISYGKISYIKDLATKVLSKEIILEDLVNATNEEVIETLVKIKGIGPWTAEMFLMFTFNRPDVFSVGDLGLKNAIQKIYGVEKPTTKQMLEIATKWSPFRTYASRVLWKSLEIK